MDETTHAEFMIWCAWYRDEMERPNRADYYNMQTAFELRRLYNFHARITDKVTLEEFRIKFDVVGEPKFTEEEKKDMTETTKTKWATFLSKGKKKKD